MYVVCEESSGFEDQLTTGAMYQVLEITDNGYTVLNDKEVERDYGTYRFAIAQEVRE